MMCQRWTAWWVAVLCSSCLLLGGSPANGAAVGTAFTYQGRLDFDDAPVNGRFDFEFRLYDAATGGTQVVGVAVDEAGVILGGTKESDAMRARVVFSGVTRCRVDAGYGVVVPGDLLTASATPGHAMRASDPMPGSVVAKALEPLEQGQRSIRVLVMLR